LPCESMYSTASFTRVKEAVEYIDSHGKKK